MSLSSKLTPTRMFASATAEDFAPSSSRFLPSESPEKPLLSGGSARGPGIKPGPGRLSIVAVDCAATRRRSVKSSKRSGPSSPLASMEASTFRVASTVSRMRRSEEHTSELQSLSNLVCRLLLEKKKVTLIHQEDAAQALAPDWVDDHAHVH